MLVIDCPWCGSRDQSEFSAGGEAHIVRPLAPQTLSDAEWADYLFMRENKRGLAKEQWVHTAGCRRWFNVERDTVSYRIVRVYIGAVPVRITTNSDPDANSNSTPDSAAFKTPVNVSSS